MPEEPHNINSGGDHPTNPGDSAGRGYIPFGMALALLLYDI